MKHLLLLLLYPFGLRAADAPDLAPIKKWIAGQNTVHTVQADFTQTRSLRALRDPVAAKGRFWFNAKGPEMRWEVGDPPRMIVLREAAVYDVIEPAKKHVDRSRAAADMSKAGRGAMMIPTLPLAKDFESFTHQFEVLTVSADGRRCHFEVLPRDPQAQKFLAAIKIDFDTETGYLLSFEIVTKDGASMRNDFTNVRMNEKLPARIFDYDLTGYEIKDAGE